MAEAKMSFDENDMQFFAVKARFDEHPQFCERTPKYTLRLMKFVPRRRCAGKALKTNGNHWRPRQDSNLRPSD